MNVTEVLAERAYKRVSSKREEALLELPESDINNYLNDIYKLLQSEKYYSYGVRNLCFACEYKYTERYSLSLLKQCILSSRIFLYEEMLKCIGIDLDEESDLFESSQRAFYSLEIDVTLTKEQKELYDLFNSKRRLVVSAPTSFGKSRITREIIAHNSYKHIVVVVPTNALLSETYFTFRMDERLSKYNLIFSTHIEPTTSDSIYIFTPEKFDLYSDEHDIDYDFFVFDEVYKVDSSDKRSSVFSNCLYKAYKKECDYYLIGPYFNKFSEKFLEKTGGHFKKFETDIVQKITRNYFSEEEACLPTGILKKLKGKDSRLKNAIKNLDGQTIVYVSRKDSAETRAKIISESRKSEINNKYLNQLVEYISKNISREWQLISFLRKGVAFHHAGVPKYIQTEIVDLFNSGIIDVIVCTPTLTEGVNTTAKNVIFFDTKKADIDLTGFEVKNITGRSGRFGQHFVGRAIFLEEHVGQDNIEEISYPIFDYPNLPDEDYIQIDASDLNKSGKHRQQQIIEIVSSYNIPLSVLKKNKYVPFENQLELISKLRANPLLKEQLDISSGLPVKKQVDTIMGLVHDVLFSESDKKEAWTTANLSRFVKYQIYKNPSIKDLIRNHNAKKEDTRIRNILELVYRYFEFSLPKYLMTFENLFNFVYGSKISLSLMITHLQYGSDETQDILLSDAGLPKSIISYLSTKLKGAKSISEIKRKIEKNPQILHGLSEIELRMLSKRI